jgi:potassium-dependent mechanosensitive channel
MIIHPIAWCTSSHAFGEPALKPSREFILSFLMGAVLFVGIGFITHAAAQLSEPPSFEDIRASVDEIEQAVDRSDITAEELAALRQKLNAASDALRANIEGLEPRVQDAEERVKQLGPPPPKDAPPEAPDIATEREELGKNFGELDGLLKQARVLAVRIDQLSERVAQKRHALYAKELFARTASVFDPSFWSDAWRALPIEFNRARALLENWRAGHGDGTRLAFAILILLAVIALTIGLHKWWVSRTASRKCDTRAEKASLALRILVWISLRTPLAALVAAMLFREMGLLDFRLEQIVYGVVAGVGAAAFGHGVARALFALERPQRRLPQANDETARCFYNHLLWASRTLGVLVSLQVVHKVLFAPLVITVATNALFAAVTTAFLVSLVIRLGRIKQRDGGGVIAAAWVHPLALLFALFLALSLVAGYAGLAAFVALRVIVAAAVFGALYLFLVATKTFFAGLSEATLRQQKFRASLGISERGMALGAALLSGTARVLLVLLAFFLIIGPWEVSTADLFDTVRNVPFGFKIGDLNVSIHALIVALAELVGILIVTRLAQRWLEAELLPRTALEPSLQLSISTIFGYAGAITAIVVALGGLGFDMQKIALIAGALSVGIGFGLQSIVSNFVSGLILLTERPIRVGDSIMVKGEEGSVRRVRVRATEIETSDQASVIIPNSEFITGVVKNWTRANTLGRIVVKVRVSYDSDPIAVREILAEIARSHPQVLQSPPPGAYFLGFGESALEFELRCIIAEMDKSLSVRSDLNYAIIKRFREAGIEIPYPQRELRVRETVEKKQPT